MTKQELIEKLTELGIEFDSNATKEELKVLLTQYEEAQDASNATPADAGTRSVKSLFSAAPVRLNQENFEGVDIGMQATAKMTSFRQSRSRDYWLGTFTFQGFGTVQTVIGSKEDFQMGDLLALKNYDMTLVYTGQTSLATADGGTIVLPRFRVEF